MHGSLSVSAPGRAVVVVTPDALSSASASERQGHHGSDMGLCSHHAERAYHGRVRLNAPLWYFASSRWCRDTTT